MNTKEHYENHLSHFYSWMSGCFEAKLKEQENFFKSNGIITDKPKTALDLGCGHGLQSISLVNLGFEVVAVDFSENLLSELVVHADALSSKIKTVNSDIMNFSSYQIINPEVIVCMGDTICHLSSIEEVEKLIAYCRKILINSGSFVLSFRDYSNELIGDKRFIPVKADNEKILTCFIEYAEDKITVTDLLHKKVNETWVQTVSSYQKLRIFPQQLSSILKNNGFAIQSNQIINGMIHIIAK